MHNSMKLHAPVWSPELYEAEAETRQWESKVGQLASTYKEEY